MTFERRAMGDLSVRVWTCGEGRPLLFLHGFERHPGDAGFLRRLGAERRVFAPEHPGYGDSEGFEGLNGMLDLVLFYRGLIDTLGHDRFDVVGHCFGGMIAAEIAAICPQLVSRLVLINSYGLWIDGLEAPDPFALSAEQLEHAKWHDPAAAFEAPSASVDPSDAVGLSIEATQNLAVAAKFLWPLPDRGLRRRLPLIKAPTLVIHGTSDGLLPEAYGKEFARLIPDAQFMAVDQAGHLPMIERETEVCEAITSFLAN